MSRTLSVLVLFVSVLSAIHAQTGRHAVDPSARYHRLIALVHLTGSGKPGDPVRPEYVPGPAAAMSRSGIIAWRMQLTDDKKMAIIHLVAVDRHAFDAILADKRPEVKVFEIGSAAQAVIETALQTFKSDFSLDQFTVVAQ